LIYGVDNESYDVLVIGISNRKDNSKENECYTCLLPLAIVDKCKYSR